MIPRFVSLFVLAAILPPLASAQTALDNQAIVKMVKSGLGEEVIIQVINASPSSFSTSPESLVALKSAGVSDRILAAMIVRSGSKTESRGRPAVEGTATYPTDVGVYRRIASGDWQEIPPEVINWKTGGVLKSIATAGVVKGDVNGNIKGVSSRNTYVLPLEILIQAAEGVDINEYQLLKLRENSKDREFRTVTGGVFHVSGGATRDLVPFESKKVAPRKWVVLLSHLSPGEYGILPPNTQASAGASSQMGKMFTFSIRKE